MILISITTIPQSITTITHTTITRVTVSHCRRRRTRHRVRLQGRKHLDGHDQGHRPVSSD